jgi:hypothetical protein
MVSIVIIPAVLLVVMLGFTIFAIVKFRGTARIVLGIIGGLSSVVLGFATLVSVVVYSFSSSFATFDPNKHNGPMGTLQLPYECEVGFVANRVDGPGKNESTYFRFRGDDGKIRMPAGTYQAISYSVEDPRGSWSAHFQDSTPRITVTEGKTLQYRVGEPIVVALKVEQTKGDKILVVPDARGCAGEDCRLDGLRGFRVLDQSGKELMEGKFEFG